MTIGSNADARTGGELTYSPPGPIGSAVTVTGLTKRYGDSIAVHDLDLQVLAGEFVTLLGPSGSGKTTTLMAIAGFQRVNTGRIVVGELDITDLPPSRRNIGVVFQSYALFPHMTVSENIAYPLKMHGTSKRAIPGMVSEVLELVSLADFAKRYPRQLSGGQQQRVALARAVVFRPPLVLMDEPLGALDRQLRDRLQWEIKKLQQSLGTTVIYVTHDQDEALILSDRIAVMNQGRIEQYGTPQDVYDSPSTSFVASFVGESNVIEGTVVATDGAGLATIRTDAGDEATGTAVDSLPIGALAMASIRPERLRLESASQQQISTLQYLEVNCTQVTYVGSRFRYELSTSRGQPFVLHQTADSIGAPGPLKSQLRIGWLARDMRVYSAGRQIPLPHSERGRK